MSKGIDQKRVHIYFSGRVQGVGFRFTTRGLAHKYTIKGWVKNLPDGTVSIHAEGEKERLYDFIKKIERGPAFGYVSKMTTDWVTPENIYKGFSITF